MYQKHWVGIPISGLEIQHLRDTLRPKLLYERQNQVTQRQVPFKYIARNSLETPNTCILRVPRLQHGKKTMVSDHL